MNHMPPTDRFEPSVSRPSRHCVLSDESARLCLPGRHKDADQGLAWVSSICALCILIALVGLKPPPLLNRMAIGPTEPITIQLEEDQLQNRSHDPGSKPKEAPPENAPFTPPQVLPVVTPDSLSGLLGGDSFPVPVTVPGVSGLRPDVIPAPRTGPEFFSPKGGEGGTFPKPRTYPPQAQEEGLQGTVILYVVVEPTGAPSKVEVKDSSGHYVLDREAKDWVKRKWRWLPGELRFYHVPFQFELQY